MRNARHYLWVNILFIEAITLGLYALLPPSHLPLPLIIAGLGSIGPLFGWNDPALRP